MRFADIPGHEAEKTRLRNMADSGHLPHALILEGKSGIGKFSLLRALAQYIHCPDHTRDGDSCGVCPSCMRHASLNHIDTHYSYPVVKRKSTDNPISEDYSEQWKTFITSNIFMDMDSWIVELGNPATKPVFYVSESENLMKKLSFTSHAGSKYKIVLMWLPERMNEQTANKLLKLIEEPFEDTLFFLSSDAPANILPTIYSRCQRIKIRPYPTAELAKIIAETSSLSPQDAFAAAHIAEGSVTKAAVIAGLSEDRREDFTNFVSLMRLAYQRNISALRDWSVSIASFPRERQISFLTYCIRMLRENLIYNFRQPELNYLSSEESGFSRNFARFITNVNVLRLNRVFADAITDLSANTNSRFVFFDIAIRVILLLKHD